jgi:CBS domain-containing protein
LRRLALDEQESRKKNVIANLYRYSDLSVKAISHQVDMDIKEVRKTIDELVKDEALEVLTNQSTTVVGKIMTPIVITIGSLKTVREAAVSMAENHIGCIVVMKDGKPFGIVTQSDIVRWIALGEEPFAAKLEDLASRPLITTRPGSAVEVAARLMIKNRIHKLPIVEGNKLLGIVTITDFAVFLSASKRPGLVSSVLRAISRGKKD